MPTDITRSTVRRYGRGSIGFRPADRGDQWEVQHAFEFYVLAGDAAAPGRFAARGPADSAGSIGVGRQTAARSLLLPGVRWTGRPFGQVGLAFTGTPRCNKRDSTVSGYARCAVARVQPTAWPGTSVFTSNDLPTG